MTNKLISLENLAQFKRKYDTKVDNKLKEKSNKLQVFKNGTDEPLERYGMYYVDNQSGNDNNDGKTESTAFLTLDRALKEAKNGDLEFRVGLKTGQSYEINAVNFTSVAIHFIPYGDEGEVYIYTKNKGTRIAFYQCHVNCKADSTHTIRWYGPGIYFDSGSFQMAHTKLQQTIMGYGASIRAQNATFEKQISGYNTNIMLDYCNYQNILGMCGNIHLNGGSIIANKTIEGTNRVLSFTNSSVYIVGDITIKNNQNDSNFSNGDSDNIVSDSNNISSDSDINGAGSGNALIGVFGSRLIWRANILNSSVKFTKGITSSTSIITSRVYLEDTFKNIADIAIEKMANTLYTLDGIKNVKKKTVNIGFGTLDMSSFINKDVILRGSWGSEVRTVLLAGSSYLISGIPYSSTNINNKTVRIMLDENGQATINSASYIANKDNQSIVSYNTNDDAITANTYLKEIFIVS